MLFKKACPVKGQAFLFAGRIVCRYLAPNKKVAKWLFHSYIDMITIAFERANK